MAITVENVTTKLDWSAMRCYRFSFSDGKNTVYGVVAPDHNIDGDYLRSVVAAMKNVLRLLSERPDGKVVLND